MPSEALGLFFSAEATATRRADPFTRFRTLEFAATFGDGVYIQAGDRRQTAITTAPQFLRLQSHIESPLVFIESAQKEIHLRV
jgi:hypothetical protein